MSNPKLNSKSPLPISKLFLCFSLLLYTATSNYVDDGPFMSKLAKALTPTPSGWSTSTSFCDWNGVNCIVNRVTSIDLSSRSLTGTLPSDLNSLSQLTTLSLQNNALSGALPSFANLSLLQTLFLEGNNFSSVPQGCFHGLTSLQTLIITDTVYLAPWTFPTELTRSSNLLHLRIDNANLVGSLPDIFHSFVSLKNLGLSYNNLTGGLPRSFAGSRIQNLWLNNQNDGFGFSGSIDVLSSMRYLSQAWLHKNQFTGPIPDLSKCTSLFDLQLRDNHLTGVVPPSLMSMTSLQNVSLDNNVLQGPVPSFGKVVVVSLHGSNSFCQNNPGPCDSRVTTLLTIVADFGFPLQLAFSWVGNDPCQGWISIACEEGKITIVNFEKQKLTGTFSPAFANLTDLRNLYLNDNNLVGSIPESLTNLSELEVLDVSNNNLSGDVPKFSTKVKFNASGNVLLGRSGSGSPNITSSGSSSLSPPLIASIAIIVVFFVVAFVFCMLRSKNRCRLFGRVNNLENGKSVVLNVEGVTMSIQVLQQVTNNFSEDNILGRGGFGVVYKGELDDGTEIAVKRMQSMVGSNQKNEFQTEITFLSKVRHKHLVALLGYCINDGERLLVYEYMPQGTLTQHLFYWQRNSCVPLTWKQRVAIALDVARGVEYLHNLAPQSFIHRDLKPSNILLGDDMRAKVADFGLVKNAPDEKDSVETRVAGTFGYLAPEYAATGRVTTKVDVYAFGIILMELITGRKALDNTVPEEMCHLVSWFRMILTNMENNPNAIDQTLNPNEETMESISKVAELACHCTAPEPYQRPDMGHVVNVLVPLVQQWRPITNNHEEQGHDKFNEGTSTIFNDKSSEILSGR